MSFGEGGEETHGIARWVGLDTTPPACPSPAARTTALVVRKAQENPIMARMLSVSRTDRGKTGAAYPNRTGDRLRWSRGGLQGPNGEVTVSVCIVTTEPNDMMAEIHDRMPVILPKDAWALWLDPAAQVRDVQPLLFPYPAELMAAHPVGSTVGNPRNDRSELILTLV